MTEGLARGQGWVVGCHFSENLGQRKEGQNGLVVDEFVDIKANLFDSLHGMKQKLNIGQQSSIGGASGL